MNQAPNFDPLAGAYRWMEWASFGSALWRCRCHFLSDLRGCRRALVLGDGDGRFTARLLETNTEIQVDAVDTSAAMLRVLVKRAGGNRERVQTYCGDARLWEPEGEDYDLVVSHFFLDCLTTEEIGTLAHRLRPHLAPRALWLNSEFAIAENWFGRWVAQPVVSGLYLAFGELTGLGVRRLPEYAKAISEEGFTLGPKRTFLGGLLVTEVWLGGAGQLLHSC